MENKNKMQDSLTGKFISPNKEVVCVENAIDYVKKQGFIVSRPKIEYITAFVVLFSILFLSFIPFAYAEGEIKEYNEFTKTVTVKDSQNIKIADVTLKTPLVHYVISGKNRLVASFEIDLSKDTYNNIISSMSFYDRNRGNLKVDREFNYKAYVKVGTYDNPIYEVQCNTINAENKSSYEDCKKVEVGIEKIDKFEWIPLDKAITLYKGKTTIGIFTDVYKGDNIEWIPNLFGVEVREWAVWQDSFNNGLKLFYKLNESSGTTALNSVNPLLNMSGMNGVWAQNGKIGTGYAPNLQGADSGFNWKDINTSTKTWAFSFWINRTSAINGYPTVFGSLTATVDANGEMKCFIDQTTQGVNCYLYAGGILDSGVSSAIAVNNYTHVVVSQNTTRLGIWINGVYSTGVLSSSYDSINYNGNLLFFQGAVNTNKLGNSILDEIGVWNRSLSNSEITDLYNAGVGITYVPNEVDSIYPIFSDITTNSGTTSNTSLINVTVTYTNSTVGINFNNTNYLMSNLSSIFNFSKSNLAIGNYTYYFYSYGNGTSKNYNYTTNYTFIVANVTVTPTTTDNIFTLDVSTQVGLFTFILMLIISVLVWIYIHRYLGAVFLLITGFIALINFDNLFIGIMIIFTAVVIAFIKEK